MPNLAYPHQNGHGNRCQVLCTDPPFHETGIDFYSGDRKMAQGGVQLEVHDGDRYRLLNALLGTLCLVKILTPPSKKSWIRLVIDVMTNLSARMKIGTRHNREPHTLIFLFSSHWTISHNIYQVNINKRKQI